MEVARILAYALAVFMAFMGIQKFIGDVPIFAIIESNLAEDYGLAISFLDPAMKYITGILELAAAAILVFWKRFYGGAVSVGIIGGAVLAHLTVLGVSTPVSSAPEAEHSPVLFIMALAGLALAATVSYLHRQDIRT